MHGTARQDVVVVGAGVIGLACALELLVEGRHVVVLERESIGAGASLGNCGTITPSHAYPLAQPGTLGRALKWMFRPDAPLYVKPRLDPQLLGWMLRFALRCNRRDAMRTAAVKAQLLQASRRWLPQLLEREGIDCGFAASGLWEVYRDRREFEADTAAARSLSELGIECELLDEAQARTLEPALLPGLAGVIVFPGDAVLRPDRLVAGLARRVRERGGEIREGSSVLAVEAADNGVRIATGDGPVLAGQAVIATGSWSPEFAARLGVKLPIQPGKGYSITYAPPQPAPLRPLVLRERRVCVTTWADGYRLGSTMEFSGYDRSLNPLRLDALERAAAEYLVAPFGPRRLEQWCGWRPMTWDDLPIIGAVPGNRRVMLATGHGMLGVSLAAATGRIVAALLAGRSCELDPAPFSPARFA
ncbi:MAG TPA: FAD-dependent oxidoreductase [Xanthomonadaceae bacterium]|nr:FAD-dependent oxidoreductase [Xanthomonadaceae bacterium]